MCLLEKSKEQEKHEVKRCIWLDCSKVMAIIAVVLDHGRGVLYTNGLVAQASFFSVSLFVILSGYSTYLADKEGRKRTVAHQLKSVKRILIQYAVATLIINIYYAHFFDMKIYFKYLISFSMSAPFYFLVFFIQLTLCAPVLLFLCKVNNSHKRKVFWHMLTIAILCCISALSIKYTRILPVHGGGQYLLGGTYVILYYFGMLFASIGISEKTKKEKIIILILSLSSWLFWWQMSFRGKLPFDIYVRKYWGDGFNPPSIVFMVFAVISFFLFYSFFSLLEENKNKLIKKIIFLFSLIGRDTLYIFMYHLLVMDIMMKLISKYLENIHLLRTVVFILMLLLPVILARGFYWIRNWFVDQMMRMD